MPDELIIGATSQFYTLTSLDVGRNLYCKVTATNVAGSAQASALAVGPIAAATPETIAPSVTTLPAVTGSTVEGSTLTTTNGIWDGTPAPTFVRQWKRGATNVGSGAFTYVTVAGDVGSNITCVVTATNIVGSVPATSNAVGPITAAPVIGAAPSGGVPSIADTAPAEDVALTVDPGTWAGDVPITYSYEWHRVDDTAEAPSNTGLPTISGSTVVGSVLTATSDGTWIGTPTPTLTRQWKRGAADVGTGTTTYTTVPDDIGANIFCIVTATNASGVASATSNAIGSITASAGAPAGGVPSIADDAPEEDVALACTPGTWTGDPTITYSYEWHRITDEGGDTSIGAPATDNMFFWLRADAGTFQDTDMTVPADASDDPVCFWKDQALGVPRDFLGPPGTGPILQLGVLNSLPVLRFMHETGVPGQCLTGPDCSDLTEAEIFIVVKTDTGVAPVINTGTYLWDFDGNTYDDRYPSTDGNMYEGFGSNGLYTLGTPIAALNAFRLYNVVCRSAEFSAYIDGAVQFTESPGPSLISFSTAPTIGRSELMTSGFIGDIAEVIMYSVKCSAPDKAQTKAYLAAKYALTIT